MGSSTDGYCIRESADLKWTVVCMTQSLLLVTRTSLVNIITRSAHVNLKKNFVKTLSGLRSLNIPFITTNPLHSESPRVACGLGKNIFRCTLAKKDDLFETSGRAASVQWLARLARTHAVCFAEPRSQYKMNLATCWADRPPPHEE